MIHEASSTFKWSNWMSSFRVPWLYNFTFFCNWPCLRKPPKKNGQEILGGHFSPIEMAVFCFLMVFWALKTLRIHTKMRIWGPVGAVWTPLRFPASNVIWIAACKLLTMRRLLVIRQIQGNLNPLWLVELLAVAVLSFQAAITFQHWPNRFLPTCHWWPLFFAAQTAGRTLSFWSWMAF